MRLLPEDRQIQKQKSRLTVMADLGTTHPPSIAQWLNAEILNHASPLSNPGCAAKSLFSMKQLVLPVKWVTLVLSCLL